MSFRACRGISLQKKITQKKIPPLPAVGRDDYFMKLAISNIAWEPDEDETVFALMQKYGFCGLEIAPTKVFSNPAETPDNEIKKYRKRINNHGLEIVAMQSLLFGHPELTIFDTEKQRKDMILFLDKILYLGSLLGATAVVFGSPKNRVIPATMSPQESETVAVEFFSTMGDIAKKYNVYFCIEANPPTYGGNFILSSTEALALVKKVNHPYFRFHLDTGAVFTNKENPREIIHPAISYMKHCHISVEGLKVISEKQTAKRIREHKTIAKELDAVGYNNWVSIEMLANSNIAAIEQTLKFVKETYGR